MDAAARAVPHQAEMRRILLDVDVAAYRALWRHIAPHLKQPADDGEAVFTIHHARTQSPAVPLKARAWSHRWLLDQGYPSGLPDDLKPKAERLYPRIAQATGISVNFRSQLLKPIAAEVHAAMEEVVLDAHSGAVIDHDRLRQHMAEAKDRTIRRLVGALPKSA